MKILNLLLSVFIIGVNFCYGQLVFEINEPSHLVGVYPSIAPSTGWSCPNLLVNGNWYNDSVVIANDGIDASACSTILNNISGQFALFYKSSCAIDNQLLNVQSAGATGAVIIDDVVGRPLPFYSLAQSSLITIPFIIISKDEGDSIISAIGESENVTVSFGDKTGIQSSDLGIYMETSIWSSYGIYPLKDQSYFTDTLLGAWIYNHSNSPVNDAQLKFYLRGKASSINEEIISPEVIIPAHDSIYIPISFPVIIDFTSEINGLDYGYKIFSSLTDSDTLDNHLTNELFFRSKFIAGANRPLESLSFFNDTSTSCEVA